MTVAAQNDKMERSPTHFVARIVTPLCAKGFAIPIAILSLMKLHIVVLTDDTAIQICSQLKYIWPGIYSNFTKMDELGFQFEGHYYVLLIFVTILYAIIIFIIVVIRYFMERRKIPQVTLRRDAFSAFIVTLLYLLLPTLFIVEPAFKRIGDFYVDHYGIWLFKNYVVLYALVLIFPLYITYAAKLTEIIIMRVKSQLF